MLHLLRRRPYSWLRELTPEKKLKVAHIGAGSSTLAKMRSGAVVNWVFDEPDPETTHHLLVHLTDSESDEVYESSPRIGMLETVRRHMTDRDALLVVAGNDDILAVRRYRIPARSTEREFVADLMGIAATAPDYVQMLHTLPLQPPRCSPAHVRGMTERDRQNADQRASRTAAKLLFA